MGEFFDQGFINGMHHLIPNAYKESALVGKSALDGMKESFKQISETLSQDFNLSPTIRPILDLENVESGMNGFNGLFRNVRISTLGNLNNVRSATGYFNGIPETAPFGTLPVQNNYIQNNYSPKSLSRLELYRQSRNLFSMSVNSEVNSR